MVKTILILAANPKNTSRLRIDQEVREIDSGLQRSRKRDNFILKQVWATRPSDFRRAMLEFKPNIVHFSGHGAGVEGIAFEDDTGNANFINNEALSGFFKLFSNHVECVLLNACYSEVQASAIAKHIKYVIGMNKSIGDNVAIEFAIAFYDALGSGESIDFSYNLACNAIQWISNEVHLTPVIKSNLTDEYLEKNIKSETNKPDKIDLATSKWLSSMSDDINGLLSEMDELIGMETAKKYIHQSVSRILLEKKLGRNKNVRFEHIVFTGNPGTGKTTVAILLARVLELLQVIKNGHIVIASRSDFVAQYMGQTALKTRDTVEKSLDGILFIDEAYSLYSNEKDSFGAESISELISQMEKYRNQLIVIFSGYPEEMELFLTNNPGLRARFSTQVQFPDYTFIELAEILSMNTEREGFTLSQEAKLKAQNYFKQRKDKQPNGFGNAREVKALFEKIKANCAERIFKNNENLENRPMIIEEDIPKAVDLNSRPTRR